jgi:nucleotide-binding universal stress UspA family protein
MNWTSKKILVVPIDFSDESFRALDEALVMVDSPAQLHVIHVLHDCNPGVSEMQLGPSEREIRALQVRQNLRERLADDRHNKVHVHVCFGDPGLEIVKHAQHVKADMVVMPSHGRGGLRNLLIGSVAERVIRLANCPVLILKTPKKCPAKSGSQAAEQLKS